MSHISSPSTRPRPGLAESRAAAAVLLGQLKAECARGTVELPCFPEVVLRVRDRLADPLSTLDQVVTVIGTEPRLAGRVVELANAAAFNLSGKPVSDLRTAVTRLGHAMVLGAAFTFALRHMREAPTLRKVADQLRALWEDSLRVAVVCEQLARRADLPPDNAFLTGLLHGIGRLYLLSRVAEDASRHDEALDWESIALDIHASIGRAILENWRFDQQIVEAVGRQSFSQNSPYVPADLSDVLVVGIRLAPILSHPGGGSLIAPPRGALKRLKLTDADAVDLLAGAERQLSTLRVALGG